MDEEQLFGSETEENAVVSEAAAVSEVPADASAEAVPADGQEAAPVESVPEGSPPAEEAPEEVQEAAPEDESPAEEAPAESVPADEQETDTAESASAEEPEPPDESAEEPEPAPVRDYVAEALSSGLAPLEMRFSQINSCYRKKPIAYRTFTYMNSLIEGVVSPEKYSYAADGSDRGIRLSVWNIEEAIRAIEGFVAAGRRIEFVTARVSPKLVYEEDFYAFVQQIFDRMEFSSPEQLCLEFPRTVLFEDEEKVRMALLTAKLLKVKTLLAGCGEKDTPVTPVLNLPFDYVLLAPWVTALSNDRSKSQAISSLVGFLQALPAFVIADGVKSDEQISVFSRADAFGYIPAHDFVGLTKHGQARMPFEEAKAQREEDEL